MAPEQAAVMEAIRTGGPIPGPVDGRADVYALGAVLYHALAGQGPPASRRDTKALDAFAACVALAPEEAACYYNRRLAYARLGEAARARRDFERARRLDPQFSRPIPALSD